MDFFGVFTENFPLIWDQNGHDYDLTSREVWNLENGLLPCVTDYENSVPVWDWGQDVFLYRPKDSCEMFLV